MAIKQPQNGSITFNFEVKLYAQHTWLRPLSFSSQKSCTPVVTIDFVPVCQKMFVYHQQQVFESGDYRLNGTTTRNAYSGSCVDRVNPLLRAAHGPLYCLRSVYSLSAHVHCTSSSKFEVQKFIALAELLDVYYICHLGLSLRSKGRI